MIRLHTLAAALGGAALLAAAPLGAQSTFTDVQPILKENCTACHGADRAEAGLRVDSWGELVRGSDHGEAVIAFDPGHSLMLELEKKLEPAHSASVGAPLTAGEVERLEAWVRDGARSPTGQAPFTEMESPLYSANQAAAIVSVIDTEHHVVSRHLHLTELGFGANARPHHVVVEPDGSAWYLSLIGENTVLKLDGRTNEILDRADFEVPGMLALHPTESVLYVGRSMSAVNPPQRIGRIDRETMESDEVDVFFPRPHALAVAPNGMRVYSASLGTNQMAAVDTGTDALELIDLEGDQHAPVQFAISPNGMTLAAATQLTGQILFFDLLDPDAPRLEAGVRVGAQPWHPVFTPDGRYLWVGNKEADQVTQIDARSREVVRTVAGEGIAQPHGSAVRPDGRYVYISSNNARGAYSPRFPLGDNEKIGTVTVIDAESGEIVRVIEVEESATGLGIRAR